MTEEELRSGLDEIKAAIFVLADRLSRSMHDLDAATSILQAVAQELRSSPGKAGTAAGEVPDALLALPMKLDALMASQARMNSQMELLARACQQLPLAVEASATPTPAHFEGMKSAVSSALGGQLEGHVERLDKLEAELAEDSRKTKDALLAVASSLNVLGDSLQGKREAEDLADLRQSLDKLVADGQKREEVLAETLGALLDAVGDMKNKFDASRDSADIKTVISSSLDEKLSKLAGLEAELLQAQRKNSELLLESKSAEVDYGRIAEAVKPVAAAVGEVKSAVEGQEQEMAGALRILAESVGDVKSRLESKEDALLLKQVEGKIAGVDAKVSALGDGAKLLQGIESAVESKIDEKLSKLAGLEARLLEESRKSAEAAAGVSSKVSSLEGALLAGFASELNSFEAKRAEREKTELAEIKRAVENLSAEYADQSKDLKSVAGRLDEFGKLASRDYSPELSQLRSSLEKIADGQNKQAELLSDLVGELSQEVDELNQRLSDSLSQQPQAIAQVIDAKLASLAQLAAQVLEEQRRNSAKLDGMSVAVANAAAPREESGSSEKTLAALQRIADNQNRQNEVIADALSAILEEVSQLKESISRQKIS